MNPNSIKAYAKIKPTLGDRVDQVFNVILHVDKPISCEEVAEKIGISPHIISGRFTYLKSEEVGLIKVTGTGKTKLGNDCDLYEVDHVRLLEFANEKVLQIA